MKRRNKNKMRSRIHVRQKLKLTTRFVGATLLVVVFMLFFFSSNVVSLKTMGATENLVSGSFIVNMGVVPQTFSNGLKPYGMIYDLMVNYNVPIKWVIEPTKIKDGLDFTYNAVQYKGGTFIVPGEFIDSTITARITYWKTQGVQGVYTTSAINVPVYSTIKNFPVTMIDNLSGKASINIGYFTNAGIPSTAYVLGSPSTLTSCYDVWSNPHADPTWATHQNLKTFVTVNKGYIWAQCHSVSVIESLTDPVTPSNQLNFLTSKGLRCYSSGKCGILAAHANNPLTPITYSMPASPIMQFIGTSELAMSSGSETWYIPPVNGKWNTNTVRSVSTADGTSPKEGALLAYGPAYDNPANGMVMYEAGHDLTTGAMADQVAAQRAYFNFLLLAGINRQLAATSSIPSAMMARSAYPLSVEVSGGSPPYTYQWSNTIGGTFSTPNSPFTNFTLPNLLSAANGVVRVTINDACSRKTFVSIPAGFSPSALPVSLIDFTASVEQESTVVLNWRTASEVNNNYFTIERSSDCISFDKIALVAGSFNSSIEHSYSSIDHAPLQGTSYYRLRQTDYDGKTEVFNPVCVTKKKYIREKKELIISPNPVNNYFNAIFNSDRRNEGEIKIVSINGAQVFSEKLIIQEGENNFKYDQGELLKEGTYIVFLLVEGKVECSAKIYKSNS